MPSSSWKHISTAIEKIYDLSPTSVLDIGVGFGKWGFLLREYLDVWANRYNKSEWLIKIDGIEIFEPYILESHIFFYDKIFVGDVRQLIDEIGNYDLIIVGDVLEHMPKTDSLSLIDKLICKGNTILINLPLGVWPQEELLGNPNEKHVSTWLLEDIAKYQINSCDCFYLIDGREFALIEIGGGTLQ